MYTILKVLSLNNFGHFIISSDFTYFRLSTSRFLCRGLVTRKRASLQLPPTYICWCTHREVDRLHVRHASWSDVRLSLAVTSMLSFCHHRWCWATENVSEVQQHSQLTNKKRIECPSLLTRDMRVTRVNYTFSVIFARSTFSSSDETSSRASIPR